MEQFELRGHVKRADEAMGPAGLGEHPSPDGPATILLVEDNEDNRAVYTTILRYYGYTDADIAEAEQVHPGRVCSDDCYGEDGKTTHPPAYAGLGGTAAMVVEVVLPWMAARAGGVTAPGHGGTNPGAEQSALRRAQREAADWLHGAERPAGLDCRFSNPVGLVRALIREAEARIASNL